MMKLFVGAFFGSFNKSSKKKKKTRSITHSDASFASTATSSSDESTSSRLCSTPRFVLCSAGKPLFAVGSNDLCLLSPASSIFDLFAIFDRDDDGKITPRELEIILRRLDGTDPPTEEEVASMVADVDHDGNRCISMEELGAIGSAFGPPARTNLREAFAVFDVDGDGKISA